MDVIGKPRSPWLAALLSLVVLGLGQFYCGRRGRGIRLFCIYLGGEAVTFALVYFSDDLRLVLPMLPFFVGLYIFGIVDAWRIARRDGAIELQPYDRWYVYAGIAVAVHLALEAPSFITGTDLETFYSASGSMEPTLPRADRWFATMMDFDSEPPPRGSVIVFGLPDHPDTTLVRRLVGLPGEKLQMRRGRLFIDGAQVRREGIMDLRDGSIQYREFLPGGAFHLILERSDDERQDNTEEIVIPDDHVFVMGDNRDNSNDSRLAKLGTIPMESVHGIADFIYWSADWRRIGMRIHEHGKRGWLPHQPLK